MNVISTANREYASRPADERYLSIDALIDAGNHDRQLSGERSYKLADLKVVPESGDLALENPNGQRARFSHWSFGQLSRIVGAPAGYLRELPTTIAADALQHGISEAGKDQTVSLLLLAPNGRPYPSIRAITSKAYTRVWDASLHGAVRDSLGAEFGLPTAWDGKPAGAYRGDRDSFLIMINGGSIVADPTVRGASPFAGTTVDNLQAGAFVGTQGADPAGMYRGIMVRNSEVGASSITIETVLFRFICGNLMLWGAVLGSTYRRRHVGDKINRDTMYEIRRIARTWSDRPASADEALIAKLAGRDIAPTVEESIKFLASLGATEVQATAAIDTCERTESVSPRSFWGVAQGLTRNSQLSGYQDERYTLDKLAGLVLARGAKLVAA